MNSIFKSIIYMDSFVLGWALAGDRLRLYFELMLARDHAMFREFSQHEYGCYRLAVMTFERVENINKLVQVRLPKLTSDFEEYEDVFRIDDSIKIYEDFFSIGDVEPKISFNYSSVDIEFVDDFDEAERVGGPLLVS